MIALLAKLNDSGMFALRVVPKPDKEQGIVLSIVSTEASPEIHATAEELCKLLGIDPKIAEYKLVQGNKNMGPDEIAVQTRSLLHILTFISGSVDIPDVHVEQGRAVPGFLPSAEGAERTRPLVVHSSQALPTDASVTVRFREYYFYIDDRDLRSSARSHC